MAFVSGLLVGMVIGACVGLVVLAEADALEVWRVLNKWVERNAEVE